MIFSTILKNLFADEQQIQNDNIEAELANAELNQANAEALDYNFDIGEVILVIKSLKKCKSSGVDLLNPEIFIEGSDILAPILC